MDDKKDKYLRISVNILDSIDKKRIKESPALSERTYIEDILWRYANDKLLRPEKVSEEIRSFFDRLSTVDAKTLAELKIGEIHLRGRRIEKEQ